MRTRIVRLGLGLALAVIGSASIPVPAFADSQVVIGAGDNLFRTALRYGVSVDAIVRRNGLVSPDRIYVGQQLIIPDGRSSRGRPTASGGALAAASPSAGVETRLHVVAPGETLFRIAQRYGSSVESIAALNGLRASSLILAGQRLSIPGARQAAEAGVPPASVGSPAGPAGRRIVIDLSDQRLYAYEDGRLVNSLIISSGTAATPTPIGDFAIYSRYSAQDMSGPGYYAPGVPWVQYFTGPYAIHGAYWHNNFGLPVSHGCVNLRTPDAEWLYRWSRQGTPVKVQG